MCRQYGMPAPESVYVSSAEAVAAFAETATFPVVAKNAEPWVRRRAPAVPGTTVLRSAEELTALAAAAGGSATFILQDYIPHDQAEDWIVHLYCDAGSNCLVLFTGVKLRSWPPNTGATASGIAVPNPELAELAGSFCKAVGFHGVADLDVRFDRRDGQYKLVDFNPRMGNQFRLFETAAGIDVLRALYLDMTGQHVPPGDQVNGRRIVVEHIDLLARIGERGSGYAPLVGARPGQQTEFAWLAPTTRSRSWPWCRGSPASPCPISATASEAPGGVSTRRTEHTVSNSTGITSTSISSPGTGTGTSSIPAVVIGAGPYGLSVAAHLRARGIGTRVFGDVMSSWRTNMPAGMCLKSTPDASSLGAPGPGLSAWRTTASARASGPCRRNDAGRPDRAVHPVRPVVPGAPGAGRRASPSVTQVDRPDGFVVTLDSGEEILTPHRGGGHRGQRLDYVPEELAAHRAGRAPSAGRPVSHTSQHNNLAGFRGPPGGGHRRRASPRWRARPCCTRPGPTPRCWPAGRRGSGTRP